MLAPNSAKGKKVSREKINVKFWANDREKHLVFTSQKRSDYIC